MKVTLVICGKRPREYQLPEGSDVEDLLLCAMDILPKEGYIAQKGSPVSSRAVLSPGDTIVVNHVILAGPGPPKREGPGYFCRYWKRLPV